MRRKKSVDVSNQAVPSGGVTETLGGNERKAPNRPSRPATWKLAVLGAVVLLTMAGFRLLTGQALSMPPAGNADPLPTGTVKVVGSTGCPRGAGSEASCTSVAVSCPAIPDLGATLAVSRPKGSPKGTVILLSGGSGVGLLNEGFVDAYTGDGFQVVQVGWARDWAGANGAGFTRTSCRPSTIFKYVFQTVHHSSRTTGFCGQGISGGGAQLAYSLTQYGLADYFDYLVIAAGPAVTALDYGCDPALYKGGPRNLCPLLTNAPYAYPATMRAFNMWENTTSCASDKPLASDISRWRADSIVAPDAIFSYPHTSMSWFFCVTPATVNVSTGQGSFLIDAVKPMNAPPDVNCYSGRCRGESVWQDPDGFKKTESEMLSKCVPNHRDFN
jgi:hypothetical protein